MKPEKSTPEPRDKIRRRDIFKVFLRSFFVQSVWNYRSLISVGFGICLFPVIKRLYSDEKSRIEFLNRHLKFFNAHPYMASYALGVSIHQEEAFAAGDKDACKRLDRLKDLLVGILGAVGDKLFWYTIKPASLVMGVLLAYALDHPPGKILALCGAFLLYNVPHIYLRYQGIVEGYRHGIQVYKRLNEQRFRSWQRFYSYLGSVAFLVFLGFLIADFSTQAPSSLVPLIGSALLTALLYRLTRNFYVSVFATLAIFIVIGIFII